MKNHKIRPRSPHKNHAQSGNALIFVLIGIALFAALSYTAARGLSSGNSNRMSDREAALAASEILSYAQRIERAVDRLRRRGCSESDIDFYDHQADDACKVFHVAGGNIKELEGNNPQWHSELPSPWPTNDFIVSSEMRAQDAGTNTSGTGSDLILWLINLDTTICNIINSQLDIETATGTPPRDTTQNAYDGTQFDGDYGGSLNVVDAVELVAKPAGCFVSSANSFSDDRNYFYYVILAR